MCEQDFLDILSDGDYTIEIAPNTRQVIYVKDNRCYKTEIWEHDKLISEEEITSQAAGEQIVDELSDILEFAQGYENPS